MERQPKFKVGQKVLLESRIAPDLNGVYMVKTISDDQQNGLLVRTSGRYQGFSYRLDGIPGEWAESALMGVN